MLYLCVHISTEARFRVGVGLIPGLPSGSEPKEVKVDQRQSSKSYKPLEPDFKGSFKGDIGPYEAYVGPCWQYILGLSSY